MTYFHSNSEMLDWVIVILKIDTIILQLYIYRLDASKEMETLIGMPRLGMHALSRWMQHGKITYTSLHLEQSYIWFIVDDNLTQNTSIKYPI